MAATSDIRISERVARRHSLDRFVMRLMMATSETGHKPWHLAVICRDWARLVSERYSHCAEHSLRVIGPPTKSRQPHNEKLSV